MGDDRSRLMLESVSTIGEEYAQQLMQDLQGLQITDNRAADFKKWFRCLESCIEEFFLECNRAATEKNHYGIMDKLERHFNRVAALHFHFQKLRNWYDEEFRFTDPAN